MRFLSIALVLACLPIFIALLQRYPSRRPWAFALIGFLLLVGQATRVNAFLYSWTIWPGPVKGYEISAIDMMALALVLTRRTTSGPRTPFWPVFGFYGAMLVLAVLASNLWVAGTFVVWQFARLALLFAVVAAEAHRDDIRRGLLTGLSLGLIMQSGFVAYQKLTGVIQAAGAFGHQNSTGMVTELAMLPLLASVVAGDRRRIVKIGLAAALVIIAGGGSRGTIGFAIGGVCLLMLVTLARGVTSTKLKVVGVGVAALAVAMPLAYMTLSDRFGKGGIALHEDDERKAFERAARAMSADHFFGVGPNQYVTVANVQGYSQRAGVIWNSGSRNASVHNAYLLTRAETGWHGELSFLLLLLVPAIQGLRFAFRHRRGLAGEVVLGSTIAIAVNIIHNYFEYAVFIYGIFGVLIVNIAIIAAHLRMEAAARRMRVRPSPAQRPVFTPVGMEPTPKLTQLSGQ